jgi:SnoaL-like domain
MSDEMDAPVRTVIDAANAGDVDAFLAGFKSDGVVDDWGREFRGTDEIHGWSDHEFIGKRVRLDIRQVSEQGGETRVIAEVGGDGFNGPSTFMFHTDGDRIARMTIRA